MLDFFLMMRRPPRITRTDPLFPYTTLFRSLLGGGFGRKSKGDFAIEAAWLSRAVGAPVRVQWTREDDIRHSIYHTTSVEKINIGLDASSKPVARRHRSAATSFLSTFAPNEGEQHPVATGMGLEAQHYDIYNVRPYPCPPPPPT